MRMAVIEERERQEALQRDKEDLAAQQRMATSANNLLKPSWWQVWIGAGGLLGLIASLSFTAWSLLQTRKALGLQQTNSEISMRAYLGVEKYKLKTFEVGKQPVFEITFKNFGQSPAYDLEEKTRVKVVPKGADPNFDCDPMPVGGTLNPGELQVTHTKLLGALTQAGFDRFTGFEPEDGDIISAVGEITYRSFGKRHTLRYAIHFFGERAEESMMVPGQNWSD